MKEDENAVMASRKENYEKLLPIYLTGNQEDNMSGSDMDSIIRRLTVVVKLHPKSKWTDDSYFNIGKAYFYKKDYESAMATFQFVSSEFKDENAASSSPSHPSSSHKKKGKQKSQTDKNVNQYTGTVKEQSQSSGFKMLKHKPVHYTDVLWLVRATAMDKNYGEANAILNYLDQDTKFPADLKDQLQLMHAFVFIQQKQYKNAVDPMIQALKFTKHKKERTRYTYILAQLYQLSGDYGSAGKTFATIPKLHPTYEMDFNARINVVKNYVASGSGSPTQIIMDLEEMAKNRNFEEFYDQIYYYVGLVQLKQGKDEQAVKSFETSIENSVSNINQKGLSFLKIGEMSMAEQDYVTAAPYYDSAATFLNAKFDTLDRVKELKDILNNLVKQISIINSQDSLQKLAQMPEKDRNKLVDQMASKLEKEKAKAVEDASSVTNVFSNQNNNPDQNQHSSTGNTWYFYNPSLRASGYNDFVKKWGNRENADNWRRANKKSGDEQTSNETGDQNATAGDNADATASGDNATRKQLLDNIPITPEKLKASDKKIFEAYYALGTIYYTNLNNIPKAIETFEKLAERFNKDSDVAKVYYNLYLLYEQTGNKSKAEAYRQRLLSEFPNTTFAAVLIDPDYFKKQEAKKNAVTTFYASTYDYYEAEQFSDVFARVKRADSLFKPNPLEAKFDLLQAFSIGKTQDRNAYIAALDSVIAKFPTGEEHDKAVEILTALGAPPKTAQNEQKDQAKKDEKPKGPSPYKFSPANPHYLVVYFNTISPKTKAISDSLANYDAKNHSLENLKVQSQLLDKNTQMIVVKQFKNKDDAMNYYDDITDSETMFDEVESIGYRVFVIDDKNFIQFYQRKNMEEYLDFFDKNYENGGDD